MKYHPHDIGPGIELERRLQLLRNGYHPLPLTPGIKERPRGGLLGSKAPILKGWQHIDYDAPDIETTIRDWERHGVRVDYLDGSGWTKVISRTTGMQGRFAALDVDVNDQTAAEAIMDEWERHLGPEKFAELPIRKGKGAKFCMIARAGGDAAARWPGHDRMSPDGEQAGCVELFYKKGQIGMSGVHSYNVDENGRVRDPAILYDWFEGPTPFDNPLQKLPHLTLDECKMLMMLANNVLSSLGWAPLPGKTSVGEGDGKTEYQYDLDTSLVFETTDGRCHYEDLQPYVRLCMANITGTPTSDSPTRGCVLERTSNGEDWLGVYDHKTQVMHLPPEAKPLPPHQLRARNIQAINEKFARLNAATKPKKRTRP